MVSDVSVTINGRFTGARQTGVQRVARGLVEALDRRFHELSGGVGSMEIVVPRELDHRLRLDNISVREMGGLRGPMWEQVQLAADARSSNLVNLCNAAPLVRESALTMIHDAQTFLSPGSYSPQFVQWYRFALPKIAARSRVVVTVSEFSKRMLARFGVSPEERTRVIYNGVDHVLDVPPRPEILEALNLSARDYVVVFGSLQEHKNLRVVLQAFQTAALRDLRLLIVGDIGAGAIEEGLGIRAPDGAVVAGRIGDGQLRSVLEGAICLVYPSTTEGFGLPPLEAMTLGCPAIVAPAGALPEVCGDAVLYANPNDPQAWADAIGRLAFDSALHATMSRKGREQAAKFTWRASAEQLYGLIQEGSQ